MFAFFAPNPAELLIIILTLGMSVITVLPLWYVCVKAGFPGWYALPAVIPVLALVMLYFLAFAEWPALRGDTQTKWATRN